MSIPLDRLYHHLKSQVDENIIIYLSMPHGSKNLKDFNMLHTNTVYEILTNPIIVCHDQEPMDYNFIEGQDYPESWGAERLANNNFMEFVRPMSHIRRCLNIFNVYDKFLLIHSEKNSIDIENFSNSFIDVYYWSHAIIARDWFRYAKYDLLLKNDIKYDFLIYNRAWSGSREYRLKFSELLVESGLHNRSLTSFSPYDNNLHYTNHQFKNSNFEISNFKLDEILPLNTYQAAASADYESDDYNACGIEVVLETLFDSQKNHLTEKILRPIACGKPFILAATPNSLQYLRDYGFKTFSNIIDETYDTINDPIVRLEYIIAEMSRISNLPVDEKLELYEQLNKIADYNKKLFFSDAWQESVLEEFVVNFNDAFNKLQSTKTGKFWKTAKPIIDNSPLIQEKLYSFGKENFVKLDYLIDQLNQHP